MLGTGSHTERNKSRLPTRDREQRIENQKALTFAVVVKLQCSSNSTINLSKHLKSCLALRNDPAHADMEPWQVLLPMSGFTYDDGAFRFTAEEMAVFAAMNEYDFMQDMMLLAERHISSLSAFKEYCVMRYEFRDKAPKPEGFNGQIGYSYLTPEELISYKPYTIPMNDLAVGLDASLEEDVGLARTVAERFGPATAKHFKVTKFLDLAFPSDDELAVTTQAPATGS